MEKRFFTVPDFFEEFFDSTVTACVMSDPTGGSGIQQPDVPEKPQRGKSSTTPSPTPLGLDEDPFADD